MSVDWLRTELHNRHGQLCEFLLRRCNVEDLPAIADVQEQVISSLEERHIFARTSTDQIEESLRKDFCVGAFCGDKLTAVTIMVVNRVTPRNLGVHLGYDEDRLKSCATYDSTFVLPQFRGYGLQRLFCEMRDEEALRLGCKEALATVSPDNSVSLGNMRANGLEVLTEKVMYTGVRRYIVCKKLVKHTEERSRG